MVGQRFHSLLRTAATATAGNLTGTLTQPVFNESARLIHLPPLRHHQSQSLLVRPVSCLLRKHLTLSIRQTDCFLYRALPHTRPIGGTAGSCVGQRFNRRESNRYSTGWLILIFLKSGCLGFNKKFISLALSTLGTARATDFPARTHSSPICIV